MFTSSSPKDENLYVLNGTETIENLAISTADDVNYFKFEILEDGSADDYIAITSEAERWDLDLEILDADGNVVVYSRMAENTGRVSLNGLKAGEYFIKVTGDNDTVKTCTLDYHFTNSALIASDVYEGMEDRNGAVDIRQSQKISGLSIASSSKENETRADTFKITMEYDGWKSSRIILTDYRSDWEGLNYVLSTDAAGTDVIASGIGSEISLAGLKAGDYYLTVDTPVENQYSEYSVIARDIPDSSSEPENTWSIFVYLAGDNNLEGAYLTDLLGMQKAILPENVEVYVLMDGSANCSTAERDWSDTRVGRIRHSNGSAVAVEWMYFEGIDTDTYVSTSTLDRMQEWDTGSISTLEAFLDWGMQTGSADNYALIMKGHGTSLGWNSADETSNSMMSITEIADLLKQDKYDDLSVVAFDQCLMGSDVVISGMENAVEYVVASEAVSYAPSQLMMYEDLFNNLETDMTARELAEKMVASSNRSGSFDLTWAAFDTSDTYLSTALNKFASHAADFTYADWTALCTAFGTAVNYGDEVCAFSDLISVLEETLKFTVSTVLEDALTGLISDVRNYVIKAAQVTPTAYGNGLSVFNPVLSSARMNQYYYAGGGKLDYYTSGIGQMAWGDFLYTVGKLAGDIAGDEWGKDPGDALEASDIDDSYVAQAVVPVPSINIEADTETVTNKLAVTATIPEYAESYYSSDLITWTKFEGTLYLEQNGLYYFKAVGETGVESNYVSLNVENIDNIAPSLQISGNPAEWSKSAVLTAVTDDETATIEFYDGTQWIAGNEFTVTANGTYKFRVTDAAGNVTEQSVIVDKLIPVLMSRIYVSSGTTRDLGDWVLFSGNTGGSGGAIENYGEVILGMNAEFTGNSASSFGGAIYNESQGTVTLGDGAIFTGNSIGGSGGAICNSGEIILGMNSEFTGNTANNGSGGAIYNNYPGYYVASITFGDGANFTGNSAGRHGGAIYNYDGTITLQNNAKFSDNSADDFGGAIYNAAPGNISIKDNAVFSGNTASSTGGAIYNTGNITIEENATFSDNVTTGSNCYGGAIDNSGGTVTIKSNAEFSGNSATYGGAIYNVTQGTVTLGDDATFTSNSASGSGGAIYNDSDAKIILGMNAEFSGNSAYNGGAIYGGLTFGDGAIFTGNSAKWGGAIYNFSTFTLGDGAIFTGNSAELGGAIYNDFGVVTLGDGAIFTGNSADDYGGAIYNGSNATVTLGDAVFATASDTVYNAGTIIVNGNVSFAGTVTLSDESSLQNNGNIDLNIANRTADDEALISDWSRISGEGSFSVTVSADQAFGTYQLANGASGFAGSITVGDGTVDYGSVSVDGEVLTFNNVDYLLTLDSGSLYLKVGDFTPPTLEISGNVDSWTNQDITLSATVSDGVVEYFSGTEWVAGDQLTVTENGEYQFRATDLVGNVTTQTVIVDKIDKVAPTLEITSSNVNPTNQDITLSAAVSDGVVEYFNGENWVAGDTMTVAENGTYQFRVTDAAGNVTEKDFVVENIDKFAPTLEITANITAATNQDITLIATVSDGVVEYFNGTEWVAGDKLTVSANGTYQFRVTDAAGNVTTKDFVVGNIDKVAPTLEITSSNVNPTNKDVVLTAAVSDGTVEYFNGENWVAGDKLTVSANGIYQFRVTDAAGNVTEKDFVVGNIDKVAPTLEISGNADNWTNQDITLSATVSDGVVEYFNGTEWVAGDTLTVTENGEYRFRATDLVGNVTTQTVIVDKIDKVAAPIPTGFTGTVAGYDAKLDWDDASDIGVSGVKGYYIRYGTSETLTGEGEFITASEFDLTGLAVGTYYYQVKTMDNAGNISEWSAAQSFEIIPGEVQNLQGDCNGLSWDAIPGVKGYIVEYSTDNFAHVISFETTSNKVDSFALPAGTYQWRVRVIGSNAVSNGENIISQQIVIGPQEIVSNANSMKDVFFANASGIWDQNYVAQHLGILNSWNGTRETAALIGKNNLADIFEGSEDANILVMTDDANGDTLFVDDIYTALPGTVAEQQARIAQIDEIRAGMGDDIVDMTSQRFAYIGDGVRIYGGLGNDTVWANNGNNTLFGDAGNDRLVGGADNDVLVGGSDNDRMHGGGGEDIFCFGENWGKDTVEQLVDGEVTLWFGAGSESNWNADTLTYTDGANSVKVSGVSADNITLIFGDDNSLRYDELVNSGCFDDVVSEKIFEDKDKGMLA